MCKIAISILQEHMKFVIDRHAHFAALETRPAELGEEMFSINWTRALLQSIADKGTGHLTKVRYILTHFDRQVFSLLI